MKKYILPILTLSFFTLFLSCEKEPEIWESETSQYSGNWYYQLLSADMEAVYVDYNHDYLLYTYNSASNSANELWIDDHGSLFPMKFLAVLDGESTEFSTARSENTLFAHDISYFSPSSPSAVGESGTAFSDYTAYEVTSGKILLGGGSTKAGRATDSIYMAITCYLDTYAATSEIASIDTAWVYTKIDSSATYEVDTTIHVLDSTSTWFDEDWVQVNDTVYYQIDSAADWTFEYDTTFSDIDTTLQWSTSPTAVEVTEEYVISGHRLSGFTDDDY